MADKRSFITYLRSEYHIKHVPLWKCFCTYINFLNSFGCEYLTEMSKWQLDDYKRAISGHKTMWHRNRRAGKTLGLSNLAVFFSIIDFGYRANKGKVVWRAPASDQLSQAQEWLRQNPFVTWISGENDVQVLMSKQIDMACLSAGKAASKGAAVMIEDEYRDVYKGLKMYDIAGRAEDMVAEGPNETRRMISASTGCRLTYFHDQYMSGEWDYCRHNYKECPWITEEYVESKRKEHIEDPYFVDQEFNAIWVARGDTAFRNIFVVDMESKTVMHNENTFKFGDHPFFPLNWVFPSPRKGGVDWNESAGHYLVIGSIDDEAIYVNFERVLTTIPELKAYGHQYKIEVESGPFPMNVSCTAEAHALGVLCTDMWWYPKVIAERLKTLSRKMIIIDRYKAAATLTNLQEAVYDENARETKLKKRSDQHGLDALMHMVHTYSYFGAFVDQDQVDYLKRKNNR